MLQWFAERCRVHYVEWLCRQSSANNAAFDVIVTQYCFGAQADPEAVQKMLVSAVMVAWPTKSPHPEVQLRGSIGEAGEIEAETQVRLPFAQPECQE
jgi:hypothetical protein